MEKEFLKKECALCRGEFEINIKSRSKKILNKKFCSGQCAKKANGLNNKGKKRTDEFKKDLSERLKGKRNPFYGKKHTEEVKNIISEKNTWNIDDYLVYNFSDEQKQIFDGIMISDGSLEFPHTFGSRLTLGFKYKETLERIIFDLNNMEYCPIYEYDYIEKRTGNRIINFFTKTHTSSTLFSEYNRWYKDGIKIIPKDINLTPLLCYWWYVMDGYIVGGNINLCTDSFLLEDIKFIQNLFSKINIKCSITQRNRIRFNKKETINYFNYIKDIKIQKEYEYKFVSK
jgi:hypothetical protein